MAFDKSQASAYVENKSPELHKKAVSAPKTAKLLIENKAFQNNVKGSHAILKMDVDVNFQDGSSCGRTALGTVTLSDKTITVKSIKDAQNLCPEVLQNTYYASRLMAGDDPEAGFELSFINEILDYRTSKIGEALETLIWQGDTANASANLNKFDGLLKQITASSDKVVIAESGSDIVAKLQSVYTAMPVKVRQASDFRIFIGEDMWDDYAIALANKNIFKPVDDMKLYGTGATLVPTPGLNGTQKVVAAKISDLHYAADLSGEESKVTMKFSMETEQYYLDYNFAVGVSAVYTNQIGIADFAS